LGGKRFWRNYWGIIGRVFLLPKRLSRKGGNLAMVKREGGPKTTYYQNCESR